MTDRRTRPAGEPFRIRGDGRVVTVQKVFTPAGERLELTADPGGHSVRPDAIALEAVAWQDPEEMRRRAAALEPATGSPDESGGPGREEPITVSNEFAQAAVERTDDGDGPGLTVSAPKLGYSIRLDARELAWLTRQDHETFTEWMETPFGPAGEEHEH
ncbi:hypothetical protein BRD00_00695 [Halobacteriales archaeon QS_8_69_26]|nr:MAG: hypothetical protein BRD00_00695 [Halobacteriales archaeon QS_8_69_26]